MDTETFKKIVFWLLFTTVSTTVYPPVFHNPQFASKDVYENITNGTFLFELEATAGGGDTGTVTIEPDPGTGTGLVVYVNTTGVLATTTKANVYLNTKLDRETTPKYDLTFVARSNTPGTPMSRKTVKLYLNDVNDEHPKFLSLSYQIQLYENATLNKEIDAKIAATDPDNGQGGTVVYEIEPAGQAADLYGGYFAINPNSGKLNLTNKLDYEHLTFLQFKICAHDRGTPPLWSEHPAELLVRVLDVQDSPPYFQGLPYMTTIFENTTTNSNILNATALDGDRGIPNGIKFFFGSGSCTDYLDINEATGRITLIKNADRDSGDIKKALGVCVINIVATENNDHPQDGANGVNVTTATTPFTLTIKDVNDNLPTFSQQVYTASVKENMTDIPLTIPGGINVKDIDQGENALFNMTVHHVNGSIHKKITATPSEVYSTGIILVRLTSNFVFDYEVQKNETLLLVATEKLTHEKHSSTSTIMVQINDTNDNDPVFSNTSYTIKIPENSTQNATVIKLNATDIDSGKYGEIEYSLRGSTNEFAIDIKEGLVFVSCDKCLDREKKDIYFMTVEAADGGGRRTSVSVEVHLMDVNDNSPKFTYSSYEVGIEENSLNFTNGYREFNLSATDDDEEDTPNSNFTFCISNRDDNLHTHFTIDQITGQIKAKDTLDYEKLPKEIKGTIDLKVIVQDQGLPRLSSSVTFSVAVKDINDNIPQFNQSEYQGNVTERSLKGTHILMVNASDNDITSPNKDFTYFIDSGGSDSFRIDGRTGNITVQAGANLDRETDSSYNLTVIAIDKGDPQRTGTTSVIITVEDINDTPPKFDPSSYEVSVFENITSGYELIKVNATDDDKNSNLTHSIDVKSAMNALRQKINGSHVKNYFNISADNGSIQVASKLDAETAIQVVLTITVIDLNADPKYKQQSATATLVVNIMDDNDEWPVFDNTTQHKAEVSENARNGTNVITVKASDLDVDQENRQIKYFINDSSQFFVESKTGIVKKIGKIDREKETEINVTVWASDSVHEVSKDIVITVIDFNDNTPFFLNDTYAYHIEEQNYTQTTNIGRIIACDIDSGENARITFSLSKNGNPIFNGRHIFSINNTTGELSVDGNLDRESTDDQIIRDEKEYYYSLTVIIHDNPVDKAEVRKNSTIVYVYVMDINDNAPEFTDASTMAKEVLESLPVENLITTVSATDKDKGENGTVHYKFVNKSNITDGLLSINETTGEIKIIKSLIGQAGDYVLQVMAYDGGNIPLNQTIKISLSIVDVNLNSPEIVNFTSQVRVYECAVTGTEVLKIWAVDKDKGEANSLLSYTFRFPNASTGDSFEAFWINNATGQIILKSSIDREKRESYEIQIKVSDHGIPIRPTISQTLTIHVTDVNDNPPQFLETYIVASVMENTTDAFVTRVRAYDNDSEPNIRYQFEGPRNWTTYFRINESTGEIRVKKKIDVETTPYMNLTIKAIDDSVSHNITEQCGNATWNKNTTTTKMTVGIKVIDINDNPPIFTQNISTGILRSAKFGTIVVDLNKYTEDNDVTQINRIHTFNNTEISYTGTLKEEVNSISTETYCKKPFCVNMNGTVMTNIVFSETMKGVATLTVFANDTAGSANTELKIYVIGDSQLISMHLLKTKPQVDLIKDDILKQLSGIIGYKCVFDLLEPYQDKDGNVDVFSTSMKFHVVDENDEVLEGVQVEAILDNHGSQIGQIRNQHGIATISALITGASMESDKVKETYIFIAAIALLTLILALVIYFYISSTNKYKRKLKAQTVSSSDKKDGQIIENMYIPGSNKFSATKNPLLNKEEEIQKSTEHLDDISDNDSMNSFDSSDFSKRNPAQEDPIEEKEVTMDMYGEDVFMASNDLDPLTLALQEHERVSSQNKINEMMNGDLSVVNGKVNEAYESLETTEV